jgi:hypothetical protein
VDPARGSDSQLLKKFDEAHNLLPFLEPGDVVQKLKFAAGTGRHSQIGIGSIDARQLLFRDFLDGS